MLPFPDGKDFAVSFIDDTDFSTKENTQPVYEFLYSLGLKGTKTVWIFDQKRKSAFNRKREKTISGCAKNGSTLEDKEYLDFVINLKKKGFEIALHGVSAGNSYREEIIEGINKFRDVFGEYPLINVFHERNIENLYAGSHKLDFMPFRILEKIVDRSNYLGHVEGSPYFWGDVARDTIKYIRLPFHNISEPNTLKVNPSMPFHDEKRSYVNYWFSSSDGADSQRFNRLLSTNSVDKLEKENGACLVYTHFAKGFVKNVGGQYSLDKGFVEVLSNLTNYSNAWFPTASELLDRLLACKMISIRQIKNCIALENRSEHDIRGLTLKVDPSLVLINEIGKKYPLSGNGKIVIENVPGASLVMLEIISGRPSFEKIQSKEKLRRLEKIKIEFYNYYGLVRGYL